MIFAILSFTRWYVVTVWDPQRYTIRKSLGTTTISPEPKPVCFNLFCHHGTPDRLLHLSWNPHWQQFKKHKLHVRKSNISLLDTSTNKQLLQTLKSKKFNDLVILAFLECCCYIQNLVIWQKEPVSQKCVIPFSNCGSCITFGSLRIRYLFYIWTTLLIAVHTFAVIIISLHIRKYAILLHMAWLNSKKLGFILFLLNSHKGWTEALVCDSVYSTVNCTSVTSYNCDTTIMFLYAQQVTQQLSYFLFSYLH